MNYEKFYENETGTLYHGECLNVMHDLQTNSFDAVIADPPYSSGGLYMYQKKLSPRDKYIQYGTKREYITFTGDNRDNHSWNFWTTVWITETVRLLKDAGYFFMFTDWRMLPTAADAVQAGGVNWRGIIVWDKTRFSRAPHKGYFRHQCEYVVWGTKGNLPVPAVGENDGPFDGCYSIWQNPKDKLHMTSKPVSLIENLLAPLKQGSNVLDPFSGSGTVFCACINKGMKCTAIEFSEEYCDITKKRINDIFSQIA